MHSRNIRKAIGSKHPSLGRSTEVIELPPPLPSAARKDRRHEYLNAVWTAVGALAPLGIAAVIVSRFVGGPSLNYTESQGPVYGGRFAPASQEEKSEDPGPLTAVTFNLRRGARVDEAISEFRSHDRLRTADVVLLQEMSETGSASMAETLGYNYVYYPACRHPRLKRNVGNAVLSRGALHDTGKILLPHLSPHNEQLRIAAYAETHSKGLTLNVYSVHLETQLLAEDRRLDQVAAVLKAAPGNVPVLVGGDFNTPPGEELERMEELFSRHGLTRVSEGAGDTWKLGPLEGTLDHMFGRGLQVVGAGTVEGSRSSDHKPLWVELKAEVDRNRNTDKRGQLAASA